MATGTGRPTDDQLLSHGTRHNAYYDDYTIDEQGRYVPSLAAMGGRPLDYGPPPDGYRLPRRSRRDRSERSDEEALRLERFLDGNVGRGGAIGAIANALRGR